MSNFYFKTPAHRARFLEALRSIGKMYNGKIDAEYAAALYILTSSSSTWQKASSYVSRMGIDIEELLANVDFSGAYSVLIELAGSLFNGRTNCNAVELMRLDDGNFHVAITALIIRREAHPLSDFISEEE